MKKTHGLSGSRFYGTWKSMKKRCNRSSQMNWKYYGGRGIKYISDWEIFENFKEDMYDSYLKHSGKYGIKNTTLDRIDVDKNYSAQNCRWVDMKYQCENKRNTVLIEYNGKKKTSRGWANQYSIKRQTLEKRLKLGWTVEESLTTPVRYMKNNVIV